MNPTQFGVYVYLGAHGHDGPYPPTALEWSGGVSGSVRSTLRDPPLDVDDEENAVRLAEHMVRELFRRARDKFAPIAPIT